MSLQSTRLPAGRQARAGRDVVRESRETLAVGFNPRARAGRDTFFLTLDIFYHYFGLYANPTLKNLDVVVNSSYQRPFMSIFRALEPTANPPGNMYTLEVRAYLQNQGGIRIIARFCTDMFHSPSPVCAKEIESKAVFLFVNFTYKPMPQLSPLRRVDLTFKN